MNSNMRNSNIINSNAAPHKVVASSGVNNPNARPSVSRVPNLRVTGLLRRAAALFAFASLFALSHPAGRAQGVAAGKPGSAPAAGATALTHTQGKPGTSPIGSSPSTSSNIAMAMPPTVSGPAPACITVGSWLAPQHSPQGPFFLVGQSFGTMIQVQARNTSGSTVSGLQFTGSFHVQGLNLQVSTYSWPFSLAPYESRYIPIYISTWASLNSIQKYLPAQGQTLTGGVFLNGKLALFPITFLNGTPPPQSKGVNASIRKCAANACWKEFLPAGISLRKACINYQPSPQL